MKMMRENLLSLLVLAVLIGVGIYFYPLLPEMVPSKFNLDGQPTSYMTRYYFSFFIPAMFAFLIVFLRIMVKASPQKFAMPNSRQALDKVLFGCGLMFLGIQLGTVLDPTGRTMFVQYFSFGMASFLIMVGNVLGKTERNFFMGIRVPWTIATEANWRATHRFAGKLMVAFGFALLLLTFFYSSIAVTLSAILIPTLGPVLYSYLYYKRYELGKSRVLLD
jgi:uncharacterized membrane protein